MGFGKPSHHEDCVGQHEIDTKYRVLRACDKIQIFKLVVKTIVNTVSMQPLWLNQNLIAGSRYALQYVLFDAEK